MARVPRALEAAVVLTLALCAGARADVVPVVSDSATGNGSAAVSMTIPSGSDRLLAVGVSTTDAVTVSSVTLGAQPFAQMTSATESGVRSEIWALTQPAVGTATVTVTLVSRPPTLTR